MPYNIDGTMSTHGNRVKNFAKNVTRIIRISDIQRLRFVPSTVQTAQKNRFKKE